MHSLLASDLPAPDSHTLTNLLYSSGGIRTNNLVWYWEAVAPARHPEWIRLAADDARMLIAIEGDAIGLETQTLDWRFYTGDTRLLAWTAHHEPIIELLRTVFLRDWTPDDFGTDDDANRRSCVRAGFSIHRLDGLRVASGIVSFDASHVHRICSRPAPSILRLDTCAPRTSAQLNLILDEFEMQPDELRELETGCVVRLDNRTLASPAARIELRAGRTRLLVNVTAAQATFVGRALSAPDINEGSNRGKSMSEAKQPASDETVVTKNSGSDPALEIGAIPVRVTFSAGRVMLPFEALRNIAPGFIFELNKRLDDHTITIHANDAQIAYGELVAVGDLIGVRVTRMLTTG